MSDTNENPAVLSTVLSSLFPPGVMAAELRTPGCADWLLPEEAQCVSRSAPARVQEFAAGRMCARRLFAHFNLARQPLPASTDRQPLWPKSLIGSITHTRGYCAAVVAEKRRLLGLGLDCEESARVEESLWRYIFVAVEVDWLKSLAAAQQSAAATVMFCAKEAFYKCQYPLVAERLRFQDARVEILQWGSSRGTFRIHALRSMGLAAYASMPLTGQYLFDEIYSVAGIAVPA